MIRNTRQRAVIESVINENNRPLSTAEIHTLARSQLPELGLRTVYRQIRDLVKGGNLVAVDYPGQPIRYELVRSEHRAHFICYHCDKLYDLEVDVPEVHLEAPPGFKISGQEVLFYGTCPKCQKRDKSSARNRKNRK